MIWWTVSTFLGFKSIFYTTDLDLWLICTLVITLDFLLYVSHVKDKAIGSSNWTTESIFPFQPTAKLGVKSGIDKVCDVQSLMMIKLKTYDEVICAHLTQRAPEELNSHPGGFWPGAGWLTQSGWGFICPLTYRRAWCVPGWMSDSCHWSRFIHSNLNSPRAAMCLLSPRPAVTLQDCEGWNVLRDRRHVFVEIHWALWPVLMQLVHPYGNIQHCIENCEPKVCRKPLWGRCLIDESSPWKRIN